MAIHYEDQTEHAAEIRQKFILVAQRDRQAQRYFE